MRRTTFFLVIVAVLWARSAAAAPAAAGAPAQAGAVPMGFDVLETASAWKAAGSDGIDARIGRPEGVSGKAIRLEYDFHGGSGYAIARRTLSHKLPADWVIRLRMRAEGAINDIEVKFVDASGANVWWWRKKAFGPSAEFSPFAVKKRHVTYAWGPLGGGELKEFAAIEIAVVAGTGGKGALLFDELILEEKPPAVMAEPPRVTASASVKGFGPGAAYDGNRETAWRSPASGGTEQWLDIAFGEERELGGLALRFEASRLARDFSVDFSSDGSSWRTVRTVRGNGRGTSWIAFPEADASFVRLRFEKVPPEGLGVAEVEPLPPSFSESLDNRILAMAGEARRGTFPRGYSKEQTYWTVAGVDADTEEVLVGEDGTLEPGIGTFSLEPFLLTGESLLDWSNVESSSGLHEGFLPIPTVTWKAPGVELAITTLVDGPPGASVLRARYRVRNTSGGNLKAKLFVAVRPFLVNPPSQFLNAPHGVAPIDTLAWDGKTLTVNGSRTVRPLVAPAGFIGVPFDRGDLPDLLSSGPMTSRVTDDSGLASGALVWDLDLPRDGFKDVVVAVPLHAGTDVGTGVFEERLAFMAREWKQRLESVSFKVPPVAQPLVQTLMSNLAYVLVNRDGPRIQPGSRAYERSWIRDGSLTSAALLRLGHSDVARDFLVWFSGHQFANGKVPCCVDRRGADPVPENDSHGQLLFLAAEYLRITRDQATIDDLWPRMEKTVAYIDALRKERRTPEFEKPEKRQFHGLLPESISHEGYSDKPVHSYWDDFFAYKGLKDAVWLARETGREGKAEAWTGALREFEKDLSASIARTIESGGIDYVPGCAEKHDFDPTSTTVALSPCGAERLLPRGKLEKTFERYVEESRRRRDGTRQSEAYTPYELRTVGALVRLGRKAEALEMLDFFMKDRRPPGWNHWAEVVSKRPREPRFIGDMPHTWVGTDFIRSFLDFFAFERDHEQALVLGAGLPEEWVRSPGGVAVSGLRTAYGPLDFAISASATEVRAAIGRTSIPPGGLVLVWPLSGAPRNVSVNGRPAEIRGREIVVRESPAELVIH